MTTAVAEVGFGKGGTEEGGSEVIIKDDNNVVTVTCQHISSDKSDIMATEGQMSLGTNSNLDLIRQRAQKAAEFYQQQQQQAGYSGGDQLSNLAQSSHSSANHQFRVLPQYSENYGSNHSSGESFTGHSGGNTYTNLSRVLSDESFESALAPASSDSFYRAKMRSGIIDMRSSYNERYSGGNSRARARTFHGPHTGNRPRTHTYALENKQPSVGQPQQPVQALTTVTTTQYQSQQQPAPQKPARTYVTNKAQQLCRSSSDLEVDTSETDAPPPAPSSLHREYGSTSSLDMLGTSDNFFNMLNEFRNQALDQRSPAPPHIKELLKGRPESSSEPLIQRPTDPTKGAVKFINGSVSGDKETVDDVDGLKSIDSDLTNSKSEDRSVSEDSQSRSEEHFRRRAFVHFDCQSVGVDLEKVIQQRLVGLSYKQIFLLVLQQPQARGLALAPDKDDPDILADTDEGDGKSNELVLSCPFFRNELGGEDERTVSLTKITAHKRLVGANSALVPSHNGKSQVRHPACCGVAILDSSPSPSGQILPPLVSHRGHVIEYVDHGAYYYRHFFYNHEHQNLFGMDDNLGPVAISIRREKLDLDDRTNNLGRADYGTSQYRIICRTSE
ncbi:Signal-induced proliferation-associated 1-like protein 1, partial [Bulinus truncatus]